MPETHPHIAASILPCGLTVSAVQRPESPTLAAALVYGVGRRSESKAELGLTHLCEHLAFGGQNAALVEEILTEGGAVNGEVGFETTHYAISCHRDLTDSALACLAGMVCPEAVDATALAAEAKICGHELRAGAGDAAEGFGSLTKEQLRVLGAVNWRANVRAEVRRFGRLTPAVVERYRREHFAPQRASLALAGPQPRGELIERFASTLASRPLEDATPLLAGRTELPTAPVGRVMVQGGAYARIDVWWIAPELAIADRLAADIAACALSGGPKSGLFGALRTEAAMAYHVDAAPWDSNEDSGVRSVAIVPARDVLRAVEVVLSQADALRSGPTEDSLERIKRRLIRQVERCFEWPGYAANWLAYEHLRPELTRLPIAQDYIAGLLAMTLGEVNARLAVLLAPDRRYAFVMGGVPITKRRALRKRILAGGGRS
ncbi:Peptidase M16 inactive domain protein [Posidoniimonas polymericola]|uniref:Peptidase M16 inactive domain protein n=1 Tax=Posidoniimonas polymericola TaxID=2528002 RepID=A0A5C5XW02_9BACT|nr:insulinase family protein [Posidoniimonas polymericola]TWT66878.1 Peptidase M16 inactive domain protein [Posidoniimonas polymericola]